MLAQDLGAPFQGRLRVSQPSVFTLTPHNFMSTAVAGWPVAWVTMSAYNPT